MKQLYRNGRTSVLLDVFVSSPFTCRTQFILNDKVLALFSYNARGRGPVASRCIIGLNGALSGFFLVWQNGRNNRRLAL